MNKQEPKPPPCTHPPARLFAWFAYDGTLVVCCCECGQVLRGAAEQTETKERE